MGTSRPDSQHAAGGRGSWSAPSDLSSRASIQEREVRGHARETLGRHPPILGPVRWQNVMTSREVGNGVSVRQPSLELEPADRLLLVDGHNLIFRAFSSVPRSITDPNGRAVNGIYGFFGTLLRMLRDRRLVGLPWPSTFQRFRLSGIGSFPHTR